MKYCRFCDNRIEDDSELCPFCNRWQGQELPSYGAERAPQNEPTPENGPMPGAGQMLQYHEQPLNSQMPLFQYQPMPQESMLPQRKKRKWLPWVFAVVCLLFLVSLFFLVVVLTRRSFIQGNDKLLAGIPTFGYTINGADYGEMQIKELTLVEAEGFFEFKARYHVTLEDDRMIHRLTLDVEGKYSFPFGWDVKSTRWSEKTTGEIEIKEAGMRQLIKKEAEKGVPTHSLENLSITLDQTKGNAFHGVSVIANVPGSIYQVQAGYVFRGQVLFDAYPTDENMYNYTLCIQPDQTLSSFCTYGLYTDVSELVFVKETKWGELRVQILNVDSDTVLYNMKMIYKNGRPAEFLREQKAELHWDIEEDPLTQNPIASDRIGCEADYAEQGFRLRIIFGYDTINAYLDEELMEPRSDPRLMQEQP